MLKLPEREISEAAAAALDELQAKVDAGADFPARAKLASEWWNKKTSKSAHKKAFAEIRKTLGEMAFGSVRCAYCEDSAADEIEHIAAKTVTPSRAFHWTNYCFACGPCNAPKGNRHAIIAANGQADEIDPKQLDEEPTRSSAFLDPRSDQCQDFFELDIGGVTPNGEQLPPTSEILVRSGLSPRNGARAKWTLEVLNLNREIVRKARETALQSYRASLTEYATEKANGADQGILDTMRKGILSMPHPTVLNELIRQRATQPKVRNAITAAPEILTWLR